MAWCSNNLYLVELLLPIASILHTFKPLHHPDNCIAHLGQCKVLPNTYTRSSIETKLELARPEQST